MTPGWTTATKSAGVDFLDAVHAFQRKHDAAMHGHATADIAMARAARRHGDFVLVGKAEDRGDGFGGAGQGDSVGLVRSKPFVAGIFLKRPRCKNNFTCRQNFLSRRTVLISWQSFGGRVRNSLASAASFSGTWTRMPPAASEQPSMLKAKVHWPRTDENLPHRAWNGPLGPPPG